jgi:hypothetical protein
VYQGTASSRAVWSHKKLGFSPCGNDRLQSECIYETRSGLFSDVAHSQSSSPVAEWKLKFMFN